MKLLSLEIHNLFSFATTRIEFQRGINSIVGENGSGKSSLANKSLLWVLFGHTAATNKQVSNRHITDVKKAYGILRLEKDKEIYSIIRHILPQSKLQFIHESDNNKDISSNHIKTTQAAINDLIGCDLNTFINTNLFGQGSKTNGFFNFSGAEKKAVLESIFTEFEEIKEYEKYFKTNISKLELKETELNAGRATRYTEIETYKRIIYDFVAKDKTEFTLSDVLLDLSSYEYFNTEIHFNNVDPNILMFMKGYDNNALAEKIATILEITKKILLNIGYEIDKITQEQFKIDRTISVLMQYRECSVCGSKLSKDKTKSLLNNLNLLKSANRYNVDVLRLQKDNMQRTYNRLYYIEKFHKKVSFYYQELDLHLQRFKSIQSNKSKETEKLNNIKLQALNSRRSLTKITLKKNNIEKLLNIVLRAQVLLRNDIKNIVYNKIADDLTFRINSILDKLNNNQLRVAFWVDPECDEFCMAAWSTTGGENYLTLSGGEQQLINFSIGLAIAEVRKIRQRSTPPILILDEPFTMLDAKNSESLMEFLLEYTKDSTVLLISNDNYLKNIIPNCIEVVKNGGVSCLSNQTNSQTY